MQDYIEIEEFRNYGINPSGSVINLNSGNHVAVHTNQQGVRNVALFHNGSQHRRSIARMVAEAFVPCEEFDPNIFDTPIHRNGDLSDYRAENLMWRPRWFAMKYHAQFKNPPRELPHYILLEQTDVMYRTFRDPAEEHGLLEKDILMDLTNRRGVFPYGFLFHRME